MTAGVAFDTASVDDEFPVTPSFWMARITRSLTPLVLSWT